MDSISLSQSVSKEFGNEKTSMSELYFGDLEKRIDAITTEVIEKGNTVLDTYKVLSDAISGGMGSVWRVHHQSWNTDLAMKRPQPRFFAEGGDAKKKQFIEECENWINLGLHPNIVSCYYVREIGGVPTIFSEWMDNGSLKDCIQDGSLYKGTEAEIQERILDIAIQAARGLQYSHENGLIHQDMKPGNLLLSKDWDAKVADFGLAKAKSNLGDSETAKTSGYTLAYCPKEQSNGGKPEKWMDVYAWALTVLEMYAGKRLWETGVEAKKKFDTYKGQCKIAVPVEVYILLKSCIKEKRDGFEDVINQISAAYQSKTGQRYSREAAKAADTADILNNQALSFIDLGMTDKAEQLLKQSAEMDGSLFLYHYNYALLRWNSRTISDKAFVEYLKYHADNSELYERTMQTLCRMRGTSATGEVEKVYSYSKQDPRPENLEPLLPCSRFSADGKYEVEGYIEKGKVRFAVDRYGYRVKDLQTGEVKDFPNNYDDFGDSTPRSGGTYMHPHYYKSQNVFFVGEHSEFIIMEADVLWIFEAKSGRLLLTHPPVVDEDGDTFNYEVFGYTKSGVIEYINWEQRWGRWSVRAMRLCPDVSLPYELAGISTIDVRLEAERNMNRYYEEALACWEKGDIDGTLQVLTRSLDDQVLTMHEPSLCLWSKLGMYFKRDALVTVLPTKDLPTPVPVRNKPGFKSLSDMTGSDEIHIENGQTALDLYCREEQEFDWCMDMFEFTFYYTLTATDMRSDNTYYVVEYLEIACNGEWDRVVKDRYLASVSDTEIRYGKDSEDSKVIDLAQMSRKGEGRVRFSLPGGYWLSNTKKGVDIGGFVFDDLFTDFRPLWNADVIACRDHNYRLVYRYLADERIEPDTAADIEISEQGEVVPESGTITGDTPTSIRDTLSEPFAVKSVNSERTQNDENGAKAPSPKNARGKKQKKKKGFFSKLFGR